MSNMTEYDRKVAQALAYLNNHNGDGQAARHAAAINNEQIDSAQWQTAEHNYECRTLRLGVIAN